MTQLRSHHYLLTLTACSLLGLAGCEDIKSGITDSNTYRTMQQIQQVNLARQEVEAENNIPMRRPDADNEREQIDRSFTVEAMVGQINGRPVYASAVLREIGTDQLERLGRDLPPVQFRQEAYQQIFTHLRTRITDELVLAEASDNLTEQERAGLAFALGKYREELVNEWGKGSPTVAERELMEEKGHGLDREIEIRRQRMIIDRYLRQTLWPKIHVSRQAIERYYRNNAEEFDPAPKVKVRVIIVRDDTAAQSVQQALADGQNFMEVARQFDTLRPDEGGFAVEVRKEIDKFEELGFPELNEAIRKLQSTGDVTPMTAIRLGQSWAMLEEYEKGETVTLNEAYGDIERRLSSQRYNLLFREYIGDLLERGSYSDVELMARAVLNVAVARYAATAQTALPSR